MGKPGNRMFVTWKIVNPFQTQSRNCMQQKSHNNLCVEHACTEDLGRNGHTVEHKRK